MCNGAANTNVFATIKIAVCSPPETMNATP